MFILQVNDFFCFGFVFNADEPNFVKHCLCQKLRETPNNSGEILKKSDKLQTNSRKL